MKRARRIGIFLRGVRSSIDPAMAFCRRGILFDYTSGEDESLARDWYVVGEDLRGSAAKFAETIDDPRWAPRHS
jgi:hypothetical protein